MLFKEFEGGTWVVEILLRSVSVWVSVIIDTIVLTNFTVASVNRSQFVFTLPSLSLSLSLTHSLTLSLSLSLSLSLLTHSLRDPY